MHTKIYYYSLIKPADGDLLCQKFKFDIGNKKASESNLEQKPPDRVNIPHGELSFLNSLSDLVIV